MLERRIEELLLTVDTLKEENRALRQRQESLAAERSAFAQRNDQVRARVEAMIGRLEDDGAHCVSEKEPAHRHRTDPGKEYFVSCPQDERADLLDSAEYLNKKMREIRDTGKVVGADRIAVMAALNMANELLRLRKLDHDLQGRASRGRVKNMRERVEGCASAHPPTRSLRRINAAERRRRLRVAFRTRLQPGVEWLLRCLWCSTVGRVTSRP